MKSMIGVLALAAVCRAVPEADPQLLLGASPLAYSPFGYNFGNLYNPYFNVLPTAIPTAAKVITPANPLVTPAVAGALPPLRPYTSHDCVTPEGCAVRTLKEHGIAKRDAEADADPEAFYGSFYNYNPYYNGYNGFYNGYYPHSYGAYPYGVNSLWNYAANGLGYATGFEQFEGYPAATAPLRAVPVQSLAPLAAPVGAPFPALPPYHLAAPALVKSVEIPAPEIKTIELPAPVVKAVPAAPLPVFHAAPFVPAPLPVVRQPVVTPVVKKVSKPVTYTHLGAHPIQPTTVFEETQEVVGHHYF